MTNLVNIRELQTTSSKFVTVDAVADVKKVNILVAAVRIRDKKEGRR